MPYKSLIAFFLLITVALGGWFFLHYQQQESGQTPGKLSKQDLLTPIREKPFAPSFELSDDKGEVYSLSDFRGKPVIINFWATWCPPCRAELPSMNRAWEKVKDQGIEMVAINVGEDAETVITFQKDHPIDFHVLLDPSGETMSQWPIKGLPTTFVIDKEGRLVYKAIGDREWDSDKLLDKVLELNKP